MKRTNILLTVTLLAALPWLAVPSTASEPEGAFTEDAQSAECGGLYLNGNYCEMWTASNLTAACHEDECWFTVSVNTYGWGRPFAPVRVETWMSLRCSGPSYELDAPGCPSTAGGPLGVCTNLAPVDLQSRYTNDPCGHLCDATNVFYAHCSARAGRAVVLAPGDCVHVYLYSSVTYGVTLASGGASTWYWACRNNEGRLSAG